jgi:hypothetical protein
VSDKETRRNGIECSGYNNSLAADSKNWIHIVVAHVRALSSLILWVHGKWKLGIHCASHIKSGKRNQISGEILIYHGNNTITNMRKYIYLYTQIYVLSGIQQTAMITSVGAPIATSWGILLARSKSLRMRPPPCTPYPDRFKSVPGPNGGGSYQTRTMMILVSWCYAIDAARMVLLLRMA